MKKNLLRGLAVLAIGAMVFGSFGVTTAYAAPGQNYIDADGDGVCDYCTLGTGTGLRDGSGRQAGGRGQGGNGGGQGLGMSEDFVDADGDGVCDNYGTRPQDGTGKKLGGGNGGGNGGGMGRGRNR